MPAKDTAPGPSRRRLPTRTRASAQPFKRLPALPSRPSKRPGSRPAVLAVRRPPKRSTATGFAANLGKAVADLPSRVGARKRSGGAGKKPLAGVLVGGGVTAAALLKRRRGRQQRHEPPAAEPAPGTATTTAVHQQAGEGSPDGGETTSTPTG